MAERQLCIVYAAIGYSIKCLQSLGGVFSDCEVGCTEYVIYNVNWNVF